MPTDGNGEELKEGLRMQDVEINIKFNLWRKRSLKRAKVGSKIYQHTDHVLYILLIQNVSPTITQSRNTMLPQEC